MSKRSRHQKTGAEAPVLKGFLSQLRQGAQGVLDTQNAAVSDQILLSGRAHLLGCAVFGQGGDHALHGGDLFHIPHFQEEIDRAALFIAVERTAPCKACK